MVSFVAVIASAAFLSSSVLAAPLPDSSYNNGGGYNNGYNNNNNYVSTSTANNYYVSTSTSMMDDTSTSTMMMDETTTMMDDTTTMMMESTSTMMMESTSTTMMMDTTSTMMADSTTTTSTSTMYGSGYNNWNSGYNSCVQQCMNTYGAPPAMYTPPPSTTTTDSGNGSGGTGSTILVMVAPGQGILRFTPFAVNASVGDTIHYLWGGSPHTVTQSSILLPCNKTAGANFSTGQHNATFTFDLPINDTNTIAYYCGVPGHCPKGMFGFINPPNANPTTSTTTVAAMMPSLIANSSELAMQAMYVQNMTSGTSAATWGLDIEMADVPTELHEAFMQNVLQTQLTFAMNPGMLEGGLGFANPDGSAVKMPADITQITANANTPSTTPSSTPPAAVGASATSSGTASPTSSSKTGGAMGKNVASSAAVGVAILVAFMAL